MRCFLVVTILTVSSSPSPDKNHIGNNSSVCVTPTGTHSQLDKFKMIAGLKIKSRLKSKTSVKHRVSRKNKRRGKPSFQKATLKFYNDFEMIRSAYENNRKCTGVLIKYVTAFRDQN